MNLQEKIDRVKYICELDDSMINGDKPVEWVLENVINEDFKEGSPKYISLKVKDKDYVWRPVTYTYTDENGYDIYSNFTIGVHVIKDGKCFCDSIEFDYEEISKEEYISFYLSIAENYVEKYGMKEKKKKIIEQEDDEDIPY